MKQSCSQNEYKEFISFTLDMKNSPIPNAEELKKLEELENEKKLQIFKIKNGVLRLVFCINEQKYDEFIENTSLLLEQGLEINMFSDQVTILHVKDLIKEITK